MVGTSAAPEIGTRFRAFISYSHRDAAIAGWLHRSLEGYRVPKHLIGSSTTVGFDPVPARLTPIFRDREDLPAATDLSAAVKAALAVSDSLIVICSPAAAASPWVAREIETFHALHPTRPVLLAIAEGEPADSFPPAIRALAAEPLAADLRKSGDGRRLGLLKLVAGITGLPLDRLAQRDAQRRQRRVMAVTLAAVAALILMSVLLAFAVLARSESERQRQQAEGLVEYMLTDLRDRLKGVGRLDVMTAVNERAMAYYGEQGDLTDLPPESLERRARILHAMGEDDQTRGQLNLARAKYREAHRTTSALLAQSPDDPERVFAQAQSDYWLGYVAYSTRDRPTALRYWTAYKARADQLLRLRPRDTRSYLEVAYADGNLCTYHLAAPANPAAATPLCDRSLDQMRRVADLKQHDAAAEGDLANRIAWAADAALASGNLDRSLTLRTEQERLVAKLIAADPDNRDHHDTGATVQIALADLHQAQGNQRRAKQSLDAAVVAVERLIAFDPHNAEWRGRLQLITRKREKYAEFSTTGDSK